MKILYAPWREKYNGPHNTNSHDNSSECPFCTLPAEYNDDTHFIIKRYKHVFICMNKYPYNQGHLLIVPFEHQADISLLPIETAQEMMIATREAVAALKKVCKPDGFNIGMNLGKKSGGSIPDHLHIHILPRFNSDTNFLSVLSQTKVISVDILSIYKKLKKILQ